MDKGYYVDLAKVRLERAKELLRDAEDLLTKESYRSANNRAFYAMEKSIKALLVKTRRNSRLIMQDISWIRFKDI